MLKATSQARPRVGNDLGQASDNELLGRFIAARDAEAFARLAARHGGMVFRACCRVLGNEHDAEDATQAVFLVLVRKPGQARPAVAAWLHKVARDVAIGLLRSRQRRARREEAVAMNASASSASPPLELRQEIDAAIAALPLPLREAIILCHLEGKRQDEAARLLGCNQGTLSRRMADGLDRLRDILTHRGVVVTPAVLMGVLAADSLALPAALAAKLAGLGAGSAVAGGVAVGLADACVSSLFWSKVKLALLGVVAASAVAVPTYLALSPGTSSGLVGHYFLNEDTGRRVADLSSSGNHAQLVGGVAWVDGRKPGSKALEFDGATGYLKLDRDLSPWLGGTATLACWMRTTQIGNSPDNVWGAGNPAVTGVSIRGQDASDVVWGWLNRSGRLGVGAGGSPTGILSTRTIHDGEWHHIAITRDATTGQIEMYIDGTLDVTGITGKGHKATPFDTIGRVENTFDRTVSLFFRGALTDVRFYNRVLTATEVQYLAK